MTTNISIICCYNIFLYHFYTIFEDAATCYKRAFRRGVFVANRQALDVVSWPPVYSGTRREKPMTDACMRLYQNSYSEFNSIL
jgi:hypothetical protein